jgi:hypothetical protein
MEGEPDDLARPRSVVKFLIKLYFICKAAMDGFSIRYLGSNSFEFQKQLEENEPILTSTQFVQKYLTDRRN